MKQTSLNILVFQPGVDWRALKEEQERWSPRNDRQVAEVPLEKTREATQEHFNEHTLIVETAFRGIRKVIKSPTFMTQ